MNTTHTLTVISVAAALATIAAVYQYRPAARDQRRARKLHALKVRCRALEVQVARTRVAGQLAVNPSMWIVFWYEHELDDVRLGGA